MVVLRPKLPPQADRRQGGRVASALRRPPWLDQGAKVEWPSRLARVAASVATRRSIPAKSATGRRLEAWTARVWRTTKDRSLATHAASSINLDAVIASVPAPLVCKSAHRQTLSTPAGSMTQTYASNGGMSSSVRRLATRGSALAPAI